MSAAVDARPEPAWSAQSTGFVVRGRALHMGLIELCRMAEWAAHPTPLKRLGMRLSNKHRFPMEPGIRELEQGLCELLATRGLA